MKVLLVDDHPMVLMALQNIIHTLDRDIAVATADSADEAFAQVQNDPAIELVLLDLSLGDGDGAAEVEDGFAVLAELRQRHPALPVVALSATERLTDMVRAVDMGAMGFVPKRSSTRVLFEALGLVVSGGVYIPPALLGLARLPGVKLADAAAAADAASAARRAAGRLARAAASAADAHADTSPAVMRPMPDEAYADDPAAHGVLAQRAGMQTLGLTPRQTEVLALLLKGLPNKLIARELSVSVETVKDHVAAVLRALGVSSRTQAVLAVSRLSQQGGAAGPA